GIVAVAGRRRRQRGEFAVAALAVHLLNHEDTPAQETESELGHLQAHLRWEPAWADRIVRRSVDQGLVRIKERHLHLTPAGRNLAEATLENR
ncbi:MAG TPA: hypothetical protein VMN57_13800, partial [Anaerolineales bacterium]|nr:hypothetical protein [Anaerolineales bacterium]